MDEKLVRLTRARAEAAGQTLDAYIIGLVAERLGVPAREKTATELNAQRAALERFLAGPKWDVSVDGRMPTADERNARR